MNTFWTQSLLTSPLFTNIPLFGNEFIHTEHQYSHYDLYQHSVTIHGLTNAITMNTTSIRTEMINRVFTHGYFLKNHSW